MKLTTNYIIGVGMMALRLGGVKAMGTEVVGQAQLEDEMAKEFQGAHLMGRELTNLMTFTGALGGVAPEPITKSTDKTRPYEVNGDSFNAFDDAFQRSCDNQQNACANLANTQNNAAGVQVSQCQSQASSCYAASSTATQTGFNVLTSSNAQFDFLCDF